MRTEPTANRSPHVRQCYVYVLVNQYRRTYTVLTVAVIPSDMSSEDYTILVTNGAPY